MRFDVSGGFTRVAMGKVTAAAPPLGLQCNYVNTHLVTNSRQSVKNVL